MMTSLFLPDMLQTDKDLYFLSLVVYHSEIWYLGTYFVAYWSHCIKGEKRYQHANITENTHSALSYKCYGMACRSTTLVLWAFILMMAKIVNWYRKKYQYCGAMDHPIALCRTELNVFFSVMFEC